MPSVARDGCRLRRAEDIRVAQIDYVLAQGVLLVRAPAEILSRDLVLSRYNSIPGKEISEMLREAGFGNIQVKPTFGHWGIVTAQKP
jgi:hypothetical protein